LNRSKDLLITIAVATIIVAIGLAYIVATKGVIDIRVVRFVVVTACTFGFVIEQNWDRRPRLWAVVVPCLTANSVIYALLWADLLNTPMLALWAFGLVEVIICTIVLRKERDNAESGNRGAP
jgi:hypothetical protein